MYRVLQPIHMYQSQYMCIGAQPLHFVYRVHWPIHVHRVPQPLHMYSVSHMPRATNSTMPVSH